MNGNDYNGNCKMDNSNNWLDECYQSYREFCIDNEVFRKIEK